MAVLVVVVFGTPVLLLRDGQVFGALDDRNKPAALDHHRGVFRVVEL